MVGKVFAVSAPEFLAKVGIANLVFAAVVVVDTRHDKHAVIYLGAIPDLMDIPGLVVKVALLCRKPEAGENNDFPVFYWQRHNA